MRTPVMMVRRRRMMTVRRRTMMRRLSTPPLPLLPGSQGQLPHPITSSMLPPQTVASQHTSMAELTDRMNAANFQPFVAKTSEQLQEFHEASEEFTIAASKMK